jgi:hypothetical protein
VVEAPPQARQAVLLEDGTQGQRLGRAQGSALMKFKCAHCQKTTDKPTGHVNRARAAGQRLFCGRRCSGLAKRKHKTKAQRVAEKAAYDRQYRENNTNDLKARRAAAFKRNYDPAKAAVYRKKRMPWHVEYCRRPEYRKWKSEYDRHHRAEKFYGPLAESFMLTQDLNRAIKERMTNYEIAQANGTFGKTQKRRRAAASAEGERGRNRPSESVDLA